MKNQQGIQGAHRLLWIQLSVSVLIAFIAGLLAGTAAARSALLGGLVSALPNALFAKQLFQHQGARAARQIVNGFYKGEALKIIVSIVLFALVFAFCNVTAWIFFVVYIGVQMIMWFAPIIFVKNGPVK